MNSTYNLVMACLYAPLAVAWFVLAVVEPDPWYFGFGIIWTLLAAGSLVMHSKWKSIGQ